MPATLDPLQLGQQNLATQAALTPEQIQLLQTYGPSFVQAGLGTLGAAYRGTFDAGQFYAAHPGAQQEFESQQAAGELKGWTPEQFAAAYIGVAPGDPRLNQFYNGGLNQLNNQAAVDAGATQAAANTAQRQADINDVAKLGPEALKAWQAANPNQTAALGALSSSLNGLNLSGSAAPGPVTYNPVGSGAPTGFGAITSAGPSRGAAPGKLDIGGGLFVNAPAGAAPGMGAIAPAPVYAAPEMPGNVGFFDQQAQAMIGNAGNLSPIQQELQRQALDDLQLGGRLGAGGQRDAINAARSAWSARGLAHGPAAVSAEILNLDAAQRARLNERRAFASTVDQNAFGQTNANQQTGLAAGQLGLNSRLGFSNLGLGYANLNEGARTSNNQLGFNYAQLGQQNRQFNASNDLAAQQFNANLQANNLAANRGYALNATNVMGAQTQDPYNLVLGRSTAPQMGSANLGAAQGFVGAATPQQFADPYNSSIASIQQANYNAQNAADIAKGNNNASIWGSVLGAAGAIGGGLLGGPAGAKLGSSIGGLFCWVAREVYGEDNPRWQLFQRWLVTKADWALLMAYVRHGERFARLIRRRERLKAAIRDWMEARIEELQPQPMAA